MGPSGQRLIFFLGVLDLNTIPLLQNMGLGLIHRKTNMQQVKTKMKDERIRA